ncbi:YY1-associated factor 2-like isoform X2 [Poecilia latipinna]|uniref:YY1-associated factor 2-like isoform X2 n=1 Tax=Poecilia latipinna TaxID=48699 RepID=UPI00072E6B5D|nr:PREDICTED: YY1-associated factor 2-like isoform X2 [Poecilia latipinna]XP_014916764.1 PREDICTED: YY1-associated factor 2-like isoform X2 [Poecilia latipinna]
MISEVAESGSFPTSERSLGCRLAAAKLQILPHCLRKPRPVAQLVAQQVNQQFASPTHPKKEKKEKSEKDRSDKDTTLKKKNQKRMSRPRLKNVDRSSAQHLEVTVGDLTVIITDFKEKVKSTSSSVSAASADQHSQSGSSSDNTERGVSRCSSPRGETSSINGETH